MSEVTIRIDPKLDALMRSVPAVVMPALAQALDDQNNQTIGEASIRRMNFSANRPPTPEGTRHITGDLSRSLTRTRPRISGTTLISAIGTNKRQFRKLEEGGTETVRGHHRAGGRRFASPDGRTLTLGQVTAQGALTKAGQPRKRSGVTEINRTRIAVWGFQRTYKPRRMIGRTLEARAAEYQAAFGRAVGQALGGTPA